MTERKTVTRDAEPLYVYFLPDYDGPVITTEVRPGLLFDTTPDNQLIGIEVLEYERFTVAGAALPESADEGLREAAQAYLDAQDAEAIAAGTGGTERQRLEAEARLRAVLAATQPATGGEG